MIITDRLTKLYISLKFLFFFDFPESLRNTAEMTGNNLFEALIVSLLRSKKYTREHFVTDIPPESLITKKKKKNTSLKYQYILSLTQSPLTVHMTRVLKNTVGFYVITG